MFTLFTMFMTANLHSVSRVCGVGCGFPSFSISYQHYIQCINSRLSSIAVRHNATNSSDIHGQLTDRGLTKGTILAGVCGWVGWWVTIGSNREGRISMQFLFACVPGLMSCVSICMGLNRDTFDVG